MKIFEKLLDKNLSQQQSLDNFISPTIMYRVCSSDILTDRMKTVGMPALGGFHGIFENSQENLKVL